jgi:hypothetical protein
MTQHPKVTVGWTIACLEHALGHLGDTAAERRVRCQFHQLVLALERDGHPLHIQRAFAPRSAPARILPLKTARSPMPS